MYEPASLDAGIFQSSSEHEGKEDLLKDDENWDFKHIVRSR